MLLLLVLSEHRVFRVKQELAATDFFFRDGETNTCLVLRGHSLLQLSQLLPDSKEVFGLACLTWLSIVADFGEVAHFTAWIEEALICRAALSLVLQVVPPRVHR